MVMYGITLSGKSLLLIKIAQTSCRQTKFTSAVDAKNKPSYKTTEFSLNKSEISLVQF